MRTDGTGSVGDVRGRDAGDGGFCGVGDGVLTAGTGAVGGGTGTVGASVVDFLMRKPRPRDMAPMATLGGSGTAGGTGSAVSVD